LIRRHRDRREPDQPLDHRGCHGVAPFSFGETNAEPIATQCAAFAPCGVAIDERGADPLLDARFALAQGYWARDRPGDRQRARTMASTIADELSTLGPRAARSVTEVRGWLDGR